MKKVIIFQEQNTLYIDFHELENKILEVCIKNEIKEIKLEKSNKNNQYKIDLEKIARIFESQKKDKVSLVVKQYRGKLEFQKKLNIYDMNIFITGLDGVKGNDLTLFPYITKSGFFQFSFIDRLPKQTNFSRRHIDKLVIKSNKVLVEGKFTLHNSTLENANLVICTRLSNDETKLQLQTNYLGFNKLLLTRAYTYKAEFYKQLEEFLHNKFSKEDVVDIYLEIQTKEYRQPIKIKLGNPRILVERFLKGKITTRDNDEVITAVPYFTMKGRNLSFRINRISQESFKSYNSAVHKRVIPNSKKDIWIIGEKYYKAQDNGYHFFKYLRNNHPEINAYYVIDKESAEARNVEPLGNIIDFQSPEHYEIMPKAKYICTTHHPELIFPTQSEEYVKKVNGTRIFLQHGVLGTKNLTNINGKQLKDFNIDMFITSSDREKQIVVRDLKFDDYQAKVTGLSRFDALFDGNTPNKNQILIIPTWRDWITNIDALKASDYLQRFNELLNSKSIKNLHEKGVNIAFCLHPNMQPYIDLFDVPNFINTIKQGDVEVQELIKESALMITDYSSVGFDFSFLEKPVIYYQFDRDRFIGRSPSHLDIERELPGVIVNSLDTLEHTLMQFEQNDFEIDHQLLERINNFNPFRDTNNSERIFNEIINFKKEHQIKDTIKYDILSQHLFKRFRKSKYYFKTMKLYNNIVATYGKIDPNLIVFESNVGKSVSDSPKEIYDELKKRNHNYKIVWVNNSIYPFDDNNVLSVKRLSPSYYRYLSKAGFWVNNQNFPHYIKKNKKTTYIQTWHGTPLKRMINDLEDVKGRDKGYKERVNNAISRWDYLISPSPYATEHFKSAFNYSKEILEVGYPRNDIFYKNYGEEIDNKKKIIKQKLGIQDDRKIILYAPTFRDDEVSAAKKHTINLKLDLKKMYEELGNEYILLLRPHVIISNALHIDQSLSDFVINTSKYNEISDLYLISDICITDYSSVMFDFANTKKPLLFFTYDFEHYKNNLRGFYMDFEKEAPGPLLRNNQELINSIKNINQYPSLYGEKYKEFYQKYCTYEHGNASEIIVDNFFD